MAQQPQEPSFDPAKLYLWVKGLESKVNTLLREVDLLKNNSMKKNDDLKKEVKLLAEELLDVKHEQDRALQKMDLIINELRRTAGIEEVMTLKKYMELWNPLNFVSQRDLERVIDAKIAALQSKKIESIKNPKTIQGAKVIENE